METTPTSQDQTPSHTQLPGVSQLLRAAWAIYRTHTETLVLISLVPAILIFLLTVGGVAIHALLGKTGAAGILVVIFAAVVFIFLAFWSEAALLTAINERHSGLTAKEAFRKSRGIIGSLAFIGLLATLAVLGGIILLVIPGIIFMVWFLFSSYVLVAEGKRGSDALRASKAYVRGRFWAVFGRLIILGIILIFISSIPGFLFGTNSEPASTGILNTPVVGDLLGMLLPLVIGPYSAIYLFLMYENLRLLKSQAA